MPWARIHFGGGGTLDLPGEVPEAEAEAVERRWREAHCRVEWLRSAGGRLDASLPQNAVVPPGPVPHNRRVRAYRYR